MKLRSEAETKLMLDSLNSIRKDMGSESNEELDFRSIWKYAMTVSEENENNIFTEFAGVDMDKWMEGMTNTLMTIEMLDKFLARKLHDLINKHFNNFALPAFFVVSKTVDEIVEKNLIEKLNPDKMLRKDLAAFLIVLHINKVIVTSENVLGYDNGIAKYRGDIKKYFKGLRYRSKTDEDTYGVASDGSAFPMRSIKGNPELKHVMSLEEPLMLLADDPMVNIPLDMSELFSWYAKVKEIRESSTVDMTRMSYLPEDALIALMENNLHIYAYRAAWAQIKKEISAKYNKDMINEISEVVSKFADELKARAREEVARGKAEKLKAAIAMAEEEAEKLMKEKQEREAYIDRITENGSFKLIKDSTVANVYQKDNVLRFVIKNRNLSDMARYFSTLEDLGLTKGGLRNTKVEAGIRRYFIIDETSIYIDSFLEYAADAIETVYRNQMISSSSGFVLNTELGMEILKLAAEKAFFDIPWLEKAPSNINGKFDVRDSRKIIGIFRDMGVIGQIRTKDKKAKVFSLTPEGYALLDVAESRKLNPVLPDWSMQTAKVLAELVKSLEYFDVVTEKIPNMDKLVAGTAPKFLGHYVQDL